MREIKFRAWDGKEVKRDIELMFFDGGWSMHGVPKGDAILMQYTGLKDKNGKEIYEGDIMSYELDDETVVFCCEWSGSGYYFTIPGETGEVHFMADSSEWEIIGNIYENPELIQNEPNREINT